MLNKLKPNNTQASILYNNILLLSRNKLFYTKFSLMDTFQNRIYLIFMHISFLFNKIQQDKKNKKYKIFCQKVFDSIFAKIELNMREIGYGDVSVNKNMKSLVKDFYNILLNCENFNKKSLNYKNIFLCEYLKQRADSKKAYNTPLINYFDKYQAFCLDLSPDSVLKGDIKFNYK